jgi:hypothetical protein
MIFVMLQEKTSAAACVRSNGNTVAKKNYQPLNMHNFGGKQGAHTQIHGFFTVAANNNFAFH